MNKAKNKKQIKEGEGHIECKIDLKYLETSLVREMLKKLWLSRQPQQYPFFFGFSSFYFITYVLG